MAKPLVKPLIQKLQQRYSEVYFAFENPYPLVQKRKALALDIATEAGFIANQRLFIQAECQRFHALPEGNVILERGAEDVEFFTLHYPMSIGTNWNVVEQLSQELAELRLCRSDRALYLWANPATLALRKQGDVSRPRRGFAHHLQHLYPLEKSWFLTLPHTACLDVDTLSSAQVESSVIRWLENEWRVEITPSWVNR